MTLLHELVARAAASAPDRPALIVDDRVTTFAALDGRVAALASAIGEYADPGDRVACVADNGPEWVDAYYGVPRAGCALGFVNQRLGPAPMADSIARLRPAVLVAGRAQLDALPVPATDLASTVVAIDDPRDGEVGYADLLAGGADRPPPDPPVTPDTTAWLIATSGTSGTPKVVQVTHRNLIAAARGTIAVRPMAGDDVYLYPFPLCHVAGYNLVMFHHEARPVVVARRFTGASLVHEIEAHRVTTVSLAPTMIHQLVEHLDGAVTSGALGSLRAVTYGSSSISPTLLRRAIDVLGADFHQGYGMTELSGNAVFLSPADHRRGLDGEPHLLASAGRPGPAVELRLLDDRGDDVPEGAVGEIAVQGEQVTAGYWEAPEVDAATFVDGWLRTGDLGRIHDGYLTVVDRKKDIIVTGGENVSSRFVEDALVTHPDVAEVAVVGAPDARWGEVVCAFVVPRAGSGLTEADVVEHGRRAIGGFQQPRRAVLVDELPRNATGKVTKPTLRASLAAPDPQG